MSNANQNDVVTDESGLRFYGIGIVTKNKPRNTDFIMVAPIEKVSGGKGRLADVENVFEVDSVDVNGIVSKEKVTGEAHIKAKWFPLSEGNRQTAPDVIEGETVRLWKYGNEDEYYWQTMYREPGIRRLETVLYCYGNLASGNTAWTKETSYWHEISTHDQHIWWKTTQSNGESFSYDIKLNTKDSNYRINDNVGNYWLLDSANTHIRFQNADGSFIEIDKQRYHGFAQVYMTHESNVIHMKTPVFIVGPGGASEYHQKAFVMANDEIKRSEIGVEYQSYTHYDHGDVEMFSEKTIDEKTKDKTETFDKRVAKVSGKDELSVGELDINSDKDINVHSNSTINLSADGNINVSSSQRINLTDTNITNLWVNGFINLNGYSIGNYLQGLTNADSQLNSRIQSLENEVSSLKSALSSMKK